MRKKPSAGGLPVLRKRAEKRLSARRKAPPADAFEERRLLHELQVQQIELELQNEEIRRSQEELRREKELLEARVLERTARLRGLASQLTLAEHHERRRLAEVLHDHVQQLLVGARLRLAAVSEPGGAGGTSEAVVADLDRLLVEAITASQELTVELYPPILRQSGLAAALEWLAGWMRERHGLDVAVTGDRGIAVPQEDLSVLLFQAVRELLFNVVKHSGAKAARVDLSRSGELLRVTVADMGDGFDAEGLKGPGRARGGFGLFNIRERLDILGGGLEIVSSRHGGCRCTLTLPLDAAQPEAAGPGLLGLPARRKGGSVRVLLADDHAVVREGLARLLKSEKGIEVVGTASDGVAAVEAARRLRPDVVIMDCCMPRMDGVEATRAIRRELPGVRVIGLSMFEEKEQAAKMLKAGASLFLSKSGDPAALVKAVRACRTPARR